MLPPDTSPTIESRITNMLQSLQDRLDSIQRSRPTTSIGTDPLPPASIPGTRHFDTAESRLWVYANGVWVSADTRRWSASATGTVSTAAGRWQDLGGPGITFFLPYATTVQFHVDLEALSATWACAGGTCLTRAEVSVLMNAYQAPRIITARNYNAWERRVSTGWVDQTIGSFDSDGASFPRGGFISVALGAGTHTFTLRYSAMNDGSGVWPTTTVSFRNRYVHLLAL